MAALCGYCKKEPTIEAHIIPKAVVRGFRQRGPDRKTMAIFPERAVVSNIQNGIFDPNILCQTCDGKIGQADRWFVEHLDTFHEVARDRQAYEIAKVAIDTRAAIQFAVSVIYRASLSKLHHFDDVSLGPYLMRAGEIALASDHADFDEPIVMINTLISDAYDTRQFVFYPVRCRGKGGTYFVFTASGVQFLVKFGGNRNVIDQGSNFTQLLRLHTDSVASVCIYPFEDSAEAQFLSRAGRLRGPQRY